LGGAGCLVLLATAVILREASSRDLRGRVQMVSNGNAIVIAKRPDGPIAGLGAMLRRVGDWIRDSGKMYSRKDIDLLASIIASAGYEPRRLLPLVLGGKLVFLVVTIGGLVAYGIVTHAPVSRWGVMMALGMPVGILVPEFILKFFRGRHAKALRRGIPDALDLLVVCTEAGLGLETAMEQVAKEMQASNRAISVAFTNFLGELRVLPDRRTAFQNFGDRSGVEGIRRMATVLAQTLQLGTPLGQALRNMAAELRRDRMVKLEERAVRLPGLLVFPLILCILPVLLITLVGPSLLSIADLLSNSTRAMTGH
jgi:tight adherence protein C